MSIKITDDEALELHSRGRPGKLEITQTKPLTTARDLALAYSPGVAVPCLRIAENPAAAYDYTARGNMVAVISNGTAVLGLGDLGALASKPVMEGKAVLFKRFADVDSIDLEIDTKDTEEFINAVKYLGPSFGGINLEDIKAPDCFIIEQRLRELMDIPVFHDDQHGTAIIAAAGLINACELTGRKLADVTMVVNGAGASAIACVELFKALGVRHENVTMVDTKGVIYQGRTDGMNQWKSAHAVKTTARTLAEAAKGADMLVGLSAKGAFTPDMVKSLAKNPIIFAMANPDPEITPEEVRAIRADAIVATGRSDYPNQVNNVLGFPYIFRGALDVRASTINDAMKLAAARALAELARTDVPEEVFAAYAGRTLKFGPEYIIPVPFDPRLIVEIPLSVAKAATESGVAKKPLVSEAEYRKQLRARLDPTVSALELIATRVRNTPQRVVFAEGEEEQTIRAALNYVASDYGTAILIGRDDIVRAKLEQLGGKESDKLVIHNARLAKNTQQMTDALYAQLQRKGDLKRDVQRWVNNNRNIFGGMMLKMGEADAMVTGLTRSFVDTFEDVRTVMGSSGAARVFGISMIITKGRALFIADTAINSQPTPEQVADICVRTAAFARQMGHAPRVALVSYSNFGQSQRTSASKLREAVALLDAEPRDFEYEGEMTADLAMDNALLKQFYPFARLTGDANILVMPSLHAANIASRLLRKIGAESVISPILIGLEKPVQILPMTANVNDILTAALLAAYQASVAAAKPAA